MPGQDLRYAVRMLASHPTFTLVALLTLALGIGANTAIFSVVDTVLLRAAPFDDLTRLAVVWETDRATGTTREPGSLPDFLDYRQRAQRLERLAAVAGGEVNYSPDRGEPVRLQVLEVTEDFLPLIGMHPTAGRTFTAEDARAGGPAHVILSDGFWTRALDRDPSAVGRTITLDDRAYTVIGIMPAGADFGVFQMLSAADYSRSFADRGARAAVDVWLPLQQTPQTWPRSTHPLFMLARTRAATSAVQEELAAIAADLERQFPENAARGVFVEPLAAVVFGPVRPGAGRPVVGRRARPAGRVRQRGQPAARAWQRPCAARSPSARRSAPAACDFSVSSPSKVCCSPRRRPLSASASPSSACGRSSRSRLPIFRGLPRWQSICACSR